jgi:Na+-translocating ferredoxin:NAD+ oxidoreductase RnfD subunit
MVGFGSDGARPSEAAMLDRLLADLRSTTPPSADPRWRQLALHAGFLAYALTAPLFHRTAAQYAAGVAATVAADLLLQFARERRVYFPLSAVITSFGIQLLCRAPSPWIYAALGAAAMAAKNLIRFRGRHAFNPSNAVLVASLLLLPPGLVAVPSDWGGSAAGLAVVAAAGVVVVALAGRLALVAAYLASFLAGALLRHAALGLPLAEALAPTASPIFPIFAFFMLTDPRTTPVGARDCVLFGLLLGAVETFLRAAGADGAPFYALFVMTLAEAVFPSAFGASAPRAAGATCPSS